MIKFEDLRIKIIEKDKKRAEELANELSSSIVINGDGLDEEILKEANLKARKQYWHLQTMMKITYGLRLGRKVWFKKEHRIVNKSNYNLYRTLKH